MSKNLQADLDALKRTQSDSDGKEPFTISVPRKLLSEFKAVCQADGLKFSHVLVTFMRDYVRTNSKVRLISSIPQPLSDSGESEE